MSEKTEFFEKMMLCSLGVLTVLGLVMVYSSSYMLAKEEFGSSTYLFSKQLVHGLLGAGLAYTVYRTKFALIYRWSFLLFFLALIPLALTLLPALSVEIKGASRWLHLGALAFQPAEPLKYLLVIAACHYFNRFHDYPRKKKVVQGLGLGLPFIFLLLQPDYGSFIIFSFIVVFSCYLSFFSRRWFWGLVTSFFSFAVVFLFSRPYRVQRLTTYLDPWKDPHDSGFQIIQSYLAFSNGALAGRGLGNSSEKLFYLPEAHNDFIFSVLGEELGFLGVCFCVLVFLSFIYSGFRLAMLKQNQETSTVMACLVCTLGLQAFLNMGVVLGLLPTKGLNLPFISYGGSSLVSCLVAVGLLFSANESSTEYSPSERPLGPGPESGQGAATRAWAAGRLPR